MLLPNRELHVTESLPAALAQARPPSELVCPICAKWAATSRAQLDNRLRNMADHVGVPPYSCQACGGTAWATTEDFIRAEPEPRPTLWQLLQAWRKRQ